MDAHTCSAVDWSRIHLSDQKLKQAWERAWAHLTAIRVRHSHAPSYQQGYFMWILFRTDECQQIHYPLSELPRGEGEMGRDTDGSTDRTLVSCDTLVNCHFLSFMNYSHYIFFFTSYSRSPPPSTHSDTHTQKYTHTYVRNCQKTHFSVFFPNTIVQYKQKAPTP